MAQYVPAGHTRQSDADHDPSVGRYVPAAQDEGFTVPSLGQ
jgi:hypothetical protein